MNYAREEKIEMINQVKSWWHTIDLGDGVFTPGKIPIEMIRLKSSLLPENLEGKTVLDVGASDGAYSFACEKRGAMVTAIDVKPANPGFETAKKILGLKAKYLEIGLEQLADRDEKFDYIVFFGVLYHLKNPFAALEILRSKTKEAIFLESHFVSTRDQRPLMVFYPGAELNNDPSNWWGPNAQCILDMLRAAGYSRSNILRQDMNEQGTEGRIAVKATV